MSTPSIIAIDGPAAAGKTTLALLLAHHLGYLYLDTGMMYRAVTLVALRRGIDLADEAAVVALAERLEIDVIPPTVDDGRTCTVLVDGEDVTPVLREARIDATVSIPSAYPGVREAMTQQQRRIAARGRVVMVGRDIGTVVLPDADLKLYLDASLETRARRRWRECQISGQPESYEDILEAMRARDEKDSRRAVAPLRPADDAEVIDTTNMDVEQVFHHVLRIIEEACGG